MCRPELARIVAEEAPARLLELEEWGADFDKTPDGRFVQKLSDGARFPRAAGKGTETGPAILRALLNRIRQLNSDKRYGEVELLERVTIADIVVSRGRAAGAWGWHLPDGEQLFIAAGAVVLACGGAGRIFRVNVFPPTATGDGYALALRAGAPLVNMEFIQIGPSIIHPFHFALSGVFWRLTPRIVNAQGETFLSRYLPPGTRLEEALLLKAVSYPFTVRNASMWIDVGVFTEIAEGRGTSHFGVYMDVSHNPAELIEREAAVPLAHLRKRGLDIASGPFEFAPAVQHFNGGVAIDADGATEVAGLFACGENAGGQHGADRPGGNSLADCQVFGRRAGAAAAKFAARSAPDLREVREAALPSASPPLPKAHELMQRLSWEMWRGVTVVRTAEGLHRAISAALELRDVLAPHSRVSPEAAELANSALVAEVVARAALAREESRGTHYRADIKAANDPQWQRQLFWRFDGQKLVCESGPIIEPPPEFPDVGSRLETTLQ
ncbi:MAG: FAD-binding protein [Armatimonadetes bacterium]|nr:FAD-binding protein [Armatimonadota bacterium]